jgi:acylphosphatase
VGVAGGVSLTRRTSTFSGHVQGVGFPYTAQIVARGFNVTGYVRNLDNGDVELVAEGENDEISRFLETIGQKMNENIKRRVDFDSPATGEFLDFRIRG